MLKVWHDVFTCALTGVEKTLEVDQPQFANCRSLLRTGPAASLRVNIRAVSYIFNSGMFFFVVFNLSI